VARARAALAVPGLGRGNGKTAKVSVFQRRDAEDAEGRREVLSAHSLRALRLCVETSVAAARRFVFLVPLWFKRN
jgi:hypothetical protein